MCVSFISVLDTYSLFVPDNLLCEHINCPFFSVEYLALKRIECTLIRHALLVTVLTSGHCLTRERTIIFNTNNITLKE